MRQILQKFIVATAMFALLVGCSSDDLLSSSDLDSGTSGSGSNSGSNSGSSSDDVVASGVGYVSVQDLLIDTNYSTISTKADDGINTDDFIITIYRETTTTDSGVSAVKVYSDTYANTKTAGAMEFTVGHYYVNASSTDEISIIAWNPEYASNDYDFSIDKEKTTTVEEIVCTPATIETTLSLSADIVALFDSADEDAPLIVTVSYCDDITVTYDINANTVTYSIDGVETTQDLDDTSTAIYFAPQGDADIEITMSGMYNTASEGEEASYQYIEWTQTVTDVSAGQSHDIDIYIDNYDEGKVTIQVTVQNWLTNNEIGVDVTKGTFYALSEDVIPDDDGSTAPDTGDGDDDGDTGTGSSTLSIVWDGDYSFDERYEISIKNGTDQTFKYLISSETGITALKVKIISETLTTVLLEQMYLAEEMDLVSPATEEMGTILRDELGFPTEDEVEGLTYLEIDITNFMPMLTAVAKDGQVTDFQFTVCDTTGECSKTIMVKVVE